MLPEAEIVVGNSNLKLTMQIKPEAAGDGHQYFAYTCNKESIQIKPQAARNGFVPQINAAAAGNRNHYVFSKFQKGNQYKLYESAGHRNHDFRHKIKETKVTRGGNYCRLIQMHWEICKNRIRGHWRRRKSLI